MPEVNAKDQQGIGVPFVRFNTCRKLGRSKLRIHKRKAQCHESGFEDQVSWVRAQGSGCNKNQLIISERSWVSQKHGTCAFLHGREVESHQRLVKVVLQIIVCY